jgi:hypothetical protein
MSKFHNFRRVDDKAKQALNASQPSYRWQQAVATPTSNYLV